MAIFASWSDTGPFRQRFIAAFAFTAALLIFGTVGFAQLPGWSWSDAFYMTVITLSSVGYEEVHDLESGGRIFATFLLIGGVTALGIWFALITSKLVEMDLAHTFRKRRTMKGLQEIEDHVIVCGAGRMGRQVIKELRASRIPYVVIDRDPERADEVREHDPDALVLERDATRDETLVDARIGRARGLVSALSADTDNLFVCLTARDLQPNLTIVSRTYDDEAASKLRKAGADHVVSPYTTGGLRMASVLLRPRVMSFLDVVTRGEGLDLLLEEVAVPEKSPMDGVSLAEAEIPKKTGLIVLAIRHGEERHEPFVYNPGPTERVRAGDRLIVLGRPQQIDNLRTILA
ncbi:MAG: potassium channel protein [Gemmatimonadota bacterium]|nr:potassium channel protein [Gemmatimonadota bacterium]